MANQSEIANDRIQQSASPEDAAAYVLGLPLRTLQAVCDLNHIETDGNARTLRRRIVADRWPGRYTDGQTG